MDEDEDLSLSFETLPAFLYGTLMAKRLLAWLLTGDENKTEILDHQQCAVLHGYSRRKVAGKDYPGIIRADNTDQVQGVLFWPRNMDDRRKLCNFEGEPYKMEKVSVISGSGEEHEAFTFVWNGEASGLGDEEWSLNEFEETRLEDWLALFEGMEFI